MQRDVNVPLMSTATGPVQQAMTRACFGWSWANVFDPLHPKMRVRSGGGYAAARSDIVAILLLPPPTVT